MFNLGIINLSWQAKPFVFEQQIFEFSWGPLRWFFDGFFSSEYGGRTKWLQRKIWAPYCWWKKSQTTTWDVWNPINNGDNHHPWWLAGFWDPSTVVSHHQLQIHVIIPARRECSCFETEVRPGRTQRFANPDFFHVLQNAFEAFCSWKVWFDWGEMIDVAMSVMSPRRAYSVCLVLSIQLEASDFFLGKLKKLYLPKTI